MKIAFTKMEGTGNDFVVIDGYTDPVVLTSRQIRGLADRHFGVGCDQVLVVEQPQQAGADFRYRIFNADGGEVEQCGNGARCFARFVRERGLTHKDAIVVDTLGGRIRPRLSADGAVTVEMAVPRFEPADIPFVAESRAVVYDLEVDGKLVHAGVVSMGNPHVVQVVDDIDRAPVTTQGPRLERHPRFPRRVNAGFMQVIDRAHIRLRVWERGVGETLGCGSGACAAVAVGRMQALLDEVVEVSLPGGKLSVTWAGEGEPVWLAGPARTVFEGSIELEAP
ncbi:MAG: diaminopimelate epimerase [Candidatus Muproteobacteria bacterium RBG_16_60_9]|uniref:Diaminopimelate epimerase n=1 Tax=Candidatus Muproteobacteria bacterium RBG_16_60_9 TaxID=1817755 RepID=A0A1F6V910_9PROT|nr:MAG: diaminopimelate epimerase [Candidatus Muproteobacteria bacterium RBG_16_60_9]